MRRTRRKARLPTSADQEQGGDDHEVDQGRGVVEVVHRVAVGREPAQELEQQQAAEQQVDRADPGCVGDEGGGEEVGERGEVQRSRPAWKATAAGRWP